MLCVYLRIGENCDLNWENCKLEFCFYGGMCYFFRGEDFLCVCLLKYLGKICLENIVVNIDVGESGKFMRFSLVGLYFLIGCVVFLCVIIFVIIIIWRRKKCWKYRLNSVCVEYLNRW